MPTENVGLVLGAAALAAGSGGFAAWVSGRLTRSKTTAEADATLAGAYSQLVTDLRAELDRREAECDARIAEVERGCARRLDALEGEVVRLGGDPGTLGL
jgi:hypothetical protein